MQRSLLIASCALLAAAHGISMPAAGAVAPPARLFALRGGASSSDLSVPQQAIATAASLVGVTRQLRATGVLPKPPEPAPHEPALAAIGVYAGLVTQVVVKIFEDLMHRFGLRERDSKATPTTQVALLLGFTALSKLIPGKRLRREDPDRFLEYLPDRRAYLA